MRKLKLPFLFTLTSILLFSCYQNKVESTDNQINNYDSHLGVYENAMQMKDFQTAIIALNYMREADTTYSRFTDTLISLYATARLYNSVISLGTDVLESHPEKDTIRELVAVSNNNLGNYNKAYSDFEILYSKQKNPSTLYNMAKIKYSLKQAEEAKKLYTQIILDSAAATKMAEFPSPNGSFQSIALPAGCYMQLANIDADQQNLNGAIANLNKALRISPGFQTAQYSLQQLKEYKAQLEYKRKLGAQGQGLSPQGLR
jgi:tetratricopeptide (TPR) repeat protein